MHYFTGAIEAFLFDFTGDDGVKTGDKEPEQLVRDDSWRQSAPTRDWDKHKKQVFGE